MQITIDVEEDVLGPLEAFPELKKVAISRAINRTVDWAKNRTLDAITGPGGLKIRRGDLDGTHRFGGVIGYKGSPERPTGSVKVTGNRIPLFRFSGRPSKGPNKAGISYQIDSDGGRVSLITNTFTAVMASGHVGFFKRSSHTIHAKIKSRSGKSAGKTIWSEKPIIELLGPSIPHVAEERPSFQKLLEVDAGDRLELQLTREMAFITTGTSKIEEAQ